MSGWGSGPWGSTPWGSGLSDLELQTALAIRENCVRLTFSEAPYFSELLDPSDASDIDRFAFAEDASTTGLDGLPARPVAPALVEQAGAGGTQLDVWTDRPFSPYPAVYLVSANNLRTSGGSFLLPASTSVVFYGLQAGKEVQQRAPIRKDFANPQSGFTTIGINGTTITDAMLGSYLADASGDYASDSGPTSLKKRLLRRMLASKGRFAHLPDYGVGLIEKVKMLAGSKVREELRAEIMRQAKEEPEVTAASCEIFPLPNARGAWVVRLKAKTKFGDNESVELAFSP